MRRKAHIKFLGWFLSLVFVSSGFTGCISQMQRGGGDLPQAQNTDTSDTFEKDQRIQEIDAEIAREERNVSDHRSLINMTYLDLWKIQKSGPATSRGGIGGDGPVDVEHEIIRLQGDITAIEKDITNRKRRIVTLTNEKARILDQKTKACFPGDTLVMTGDGRLKAIRLVNAGDMLMTFDIGSQHMVPKPVLETYQSENNHYYVINDAIRTTAFERLLTTKGWKEVIQLRIGDEVVTDKGPVTIDTLTVTGEIHTVHNLKVADSHTFYVGDDGQNHYLVHNTGGGGGGGGSK